MTQAYIDIPSIVVSTADKNSSNSHLITLICGEFLRNADEASLELIRWSELCMLMGFKTAPRLCPFTFIPKKSPV